MSERIGRVLRAQVLERARAHASIAGMHDDATLISHEPDHIITVHHGGTSSLENLAYTCHQGGRYKGPNLASIDPDSGERTFLFNPRADLWQDHFRCDGPRIVAISATGRATARLLRFNDARRLTARALLLSAGLWTQ